MKRAAHHWTFSKRNPKPPNRRRRTWCFESLESRRLLAAGDPDLTFSTDALAAAGLRSTMLRSFGADATLDSAGRVVLVGRAFDGYSRYSPDFAVARVLADGSPDLSFGNDGQTVTDFGGAYNSREQANAVAIDSAGRIIAAGRANLGVGSDFALARYLSSGALDTSFGSNGMVTTEIGAIDDEIFDVQLDSLGRIVVAGGTQGKFALARYLATGALDTTFGTGGIVVTDLQGSDGANALLVLPDGRLVAAGADGTDFALARYSDNGALDASFGTGGKVIYDTGPVPTNPKYDRFDRAKTIVRDGAGRLIIAGESEDDIAFVRFLENGSLDTSFGNAGVRLINTGLSVECINSLIIDSAGRLVGTGYRGNQALLTRLTAAGQLDTSFDQDGWVALDLGNTSAEGNAVLLRSDKVIMAGSVEPGNHSTSNALVMQFGENGSVDTAFGSQGQSLIRFLGAGDGIARATLVQPDGKVIVAGEISVTPAQADTDFALTRFNADGSLDTSFGHGGQVTTGFTPGVKDSIAALAFDGNKIIAVGHTAFADFALARYNADGTLDSTFGNGGKVVIDINGDSDDASALLVAPDGKIVIAGSAASPAPEYMGDYDVALVRLNNNGTLDTSFGNGGKTLTDLRTPRDYATALGRQSDGKLIVGASDLFQSLVALRYRPDGTLDTSFGQGGIARYGIEGKHDTLNALVVLPDDSIVASGASDSISALVKLYSDGSLDPSFGTQGVFYLPDPQLKSAYRGLTRQADGKLLVALETDTGLAVARIKPDGTFDLNYGVDGVSRFDATSGPASPAGIALTADGRTVVGVDLKAGYHTQFGAIRFQGDLVPPAQGAFQFASNTFTGNEGATATVTVRRAGGSQGTAAVNYAATAGTATADADFTPTSGTLTFGPGVTEQTFTVALKNDTIEEGAETIALVLSNVSGGAAIDNPYRAKLIIAGEPTEAGLLDPTFGQDGIAIGSTVIDTTLLPGKDGATALQPDGKVVVVGKTEYPGANWTVERYNPDGTPDIDFGDQGKVITDFALGGGFDAPHAVAILPDGKILVAGDASVNNPGGSDVKVTAALARYNSDGSLDTSFGDGGRVFGEFRAFPVNDMQVLPDGKIVIGGNLSPPYPNDTDRSFVRRYNSNGTVDETFASAGVRYTPDSIEDLVLQPDGKIVTIGQKRGTTNDTNQISLGRYLADGTPDGTFGTAGRVTTDLGPSTDDVPYAGAVQADGKLVIVGEKETTAFVARYTTAGLLDTSFNGTGVNTVAFPSFWESEYGRAVAIQEDGKILLGANIGPFADDAGIARFNTDGTLNTSFGTSGMTVFTFGDGFEPAQIILQPDGKALVAGVATDSEGANHLALARLLADPRRGNLQFNASSYRVDENTGLATITVQRTGGTDGEVTVNYSVTSGTAQANSDFLSTSGTLTFADSESEKTFAVTLLDNAATEGDETVQLALSAPGGGAALGQQTTALLHIYDGPGTIGFYQSQYYAGEDFGRVDVALVRNDGSDGTASVTFSIAGDTATPDADYMDLRQVVTFGDGETIKNVSITILNDNIVEGLETATLNLSSLTGGATLDPLHTATLLLFDQETGEAHTPGSPDASWGTSGVVETDFSPAQDGTAYDHGRDIAIQSNGRAVVIGSSDTVGGTRDFAVARYLSDGSLDTSFGGDGRVTTDLGGRDEAEHVLVQSDGRIVVVGYTVRNGMSDFALVRYLPSGSLDTSFGLGGVVLTDFSKADDRAYSATIDSQGRIVVVGSSGDAFHRDFALARYLATGALDTTFSGDGRLTTDFDGRSDIGRDVAIDNNGKIVAVGGTTGFDSTRHTAGDIAAVRYLPDGTLDASFDGDGRVRTNVNVLDSDTLNDDEARRVIVLSDGALLVGGTSDDNFLLTRFLANGQTDTSFGMTQSGFTALNFDSSRGTSYDQLRDMLLQADGKIVAVGTGHSWMGLARFDANGIVDPTFGAGGFYVSPALYSSANGVAFYDSRLYIVTDHFDDFQIGRYTTEPGSPVYGSFNLASQYTTVSENVGVAKIGVTRPFDAAYGTVTVNYLVTAGTATAVQDFIPTSGVLTFFEGETYKEVSIPIVNDTINESDETIQMFLFNPTGGAELGSVVRGTLTIDDNDFLPRSGFSLGYGDYSATENQGTVTIAVSRTNATGPATVQYVTSDGSAQAGEDYGFVQGTLTFAAGETYKDVSITIVDDNGIEGNEKFTFTIFNATGSTRIESFNRSVDVNIIDFEPIICNNAGALDTTFDGDGKATYTPTGLDPSNGVMLQQPDGKLVIAGTAWNSSLKKNVTLVARFLESGALDATFGTAGSFTLPARTDNDQVSQIFWQSGKLLIVGTSAGLQVDGVQLMRLNQDGSLDTTFGNGGVAAYDLTHPFDEMQSFVMQSDGKVVAAGYVENGEDGDRVVLRFTANGALDSSFGNGGQFYYDSSSYDGGVSAMVIDPNGKILISSWADLMRLNTNGTLDTTFGQGGFLRTDLVDGDFDAMLFQPDGKLLLAKQDYVYAPDFASVVSVLRLNSNFIPDATFGEGGVATANFQSHVTPSQLALQTDGRILVAGGTRDFSVARFYPDGVLDIGFGADGIVLTDFSGSDSANSLLVRSDGKIVVSGVKSDGFAIARHVGGQSIGAFRIGAPTYNVQENGGSISVPVLRVCGMDQAVSVRYATVDGTAVAGTDFDARSGTLSWANRQFGPQIVTIPIQDDEVFRGSRTFTLDLSQPGGGAGLQPPSTSAITIQDDEAPGRLGLHWPFVNVNEADGTASIQIDRVGGSGGPVSVTLTAASGTALAGSDYQFTSQVVTFANKETTKTVTIPIVDDGILEDLESFSLALSNPQGGATLTNMLVAAEVEIVDNEVPQPGTLELATTRATRSEDDESATLVVRRTGGTSGAVQATITLGSSSASNGLDFATDDPVTVSFAPGQESVSISIPIIDDLLVEPAEQVTFVLGNPTGGAALGDKISSTLTILDNDYVANDVLTWQNLRNPYDVNDDGFVSPIDALLIINEINVNGPHKLALPGVGVTPPPYFDVSGDGYVVALDVLLVINYINVHLHAQIAEGEATTSRFAAVDAWFSDFDKNLAPPLEEFFIRRR